MKTTRITGAIAGALVLTLGLIYWMQALVTAGEPAAPPARPIRMLSAALPDPKPPRPRPNRVEPPPSPVEQPTIAPNAHPTRHTVGTFAPAGHRAQASFGPGDLLAGDHGWTADTDYLLLTRIQPNYPPQAERRNLEGVVVLEFTITEQGTADDITVVRSTDAVFERAAESALARYRYEPRVVGGHPVAVPGARVEFVFEFDD